MSESLLSRQLRRLGLSPDAAPDPATWSQFLDRVEEAYRGHEQDRYLLERAMTVSSTEMRELHARLNRDREWLRAVIDSLDVGLIVLDTQQGVELANPEAARIVGVSVPQLLAWTRDDLRGLGEQDAEMRSLLKGLIDGEGTPTGRGGLHDAMLCSADGRAVPVSISVVPVEHRGTALGAVVVLRDLSELHHLEITLRQAQKLEAVGRLAAGIAHELNTPIQFIGDNLKFLRSCQDDLMSAVTIATETCRREPDCVDDLSYLKAELPEVLAQSLDGVERVTSIVRAMKSFAHPGVGHHGPADLNRALQDTVIVARNEVKEVAEVQLDLGDLPSVDCMVHDLKQVFLNLVVNAAHAIADRQRERPGPGLITIRTALDGDDAVIEVSDNGCGIPDEIADRVYEPFFTTKEVGRGSGQGLALARNVIVEGHQGTISLRSQPMQGTTFVVRLPVQRTRS